MIKLILKGLILGSTCIVLGYLMLRNNMKVKRVEKLCDTLREDQRLVIHKAKDCGQVLMDCNIDATMVYNKFKPLCYQVELGGDQTIFLCKNIDDKSFLFVTLWGDKKLIPINYKLEINRDSNRIRILGQDFNGLHKNIMDDFCNRLIKFCNA